MEFRRVLCRSRPQEDRIMRFVLLGNLSADWATRQSERTSSAKKKLKELGMTLESVNYTQGAYDFVDIVEAHDAEAMLAFSNSEERRVGKEGVRQCRSRWSPSH